MCKNVLKIVTLTILLACIVVTPLVGVRFGGYNLPSIFEDDSFLSDIQFGGGSTVTLAISEDSVIDVTEETLTKIADVLQKRFRSRGYLDATTQVVEENVVLKISQSAYVDSIIAEVANKGHWAIQGPSGGTDLCEASMVESYEIATNANGSYGITLNFTEEGKAKFISNTASYALTSQYVMLMVDDQPYTYATVPNNVTDSFTFGTWDYSTASTLYTLLESGELPGDSGDVIVSSVEPLAPAMNKTLLYTIYGIVAAVLVLACIVLILKGKWMGVFSSMSLIATGAIFLVVLLNGTYQIQLATVLTMIVTTVLAFAFQIKPVSMIGDRSKAGKNITAADLKVLRKYSIKGIWYHAILFAITVVFWMFSRGVVLNVAMLFLTFSLAHLACYFIFPFFGAYILADMKK